MERPEEEERFKKELGKVFFYFFFFFGKVYIFMWEIFAGNRVLLFHGSRLSNWAGILGQGLRIAPPEAPPTGYMFGKGVYFADMASKSANYCWATPSRFAITKLFCLIALLTGSSQGS